MSYHLSLAWKCEIMEVLNKKCQTEKINRSIRAFVWTVWTTKVEKYWSTFSDFLIKQIVKVLVGVYLKVGQIFFSYFLIKRNS